jgi:hypothetical protein
LFEKRLIPNIGNALSPKQKPNKTHTNPNKSKQNPNKTHTNPNKSKHVWLKQHQTTPLTPWREKARYKP